MANKFERGTESSPSVRERAINIRDTVVQKIKETPEDILLNDGYYLPVMVIYGGFIGRELAKNGINKPSEIIGVAGATIITLFLGKSYGSANRERKALKREVESKDWQIESLSEVLDHYREQEQLLWESDSFEDPNC